MYIIQLVGYGSYIKLTRLRPDCFTWPTRPDLTIGFYILVDGCGQCMSTDYGANG